MAREFAKAFYDSAAWRKCRKTFLAYRRAADGGMCQRCHEKPGYIIHHRTELTPENITDPDITLNMDNLMYVCHECHNIMHGYAKDLPERSISYCFSPDGTPVPLRLKG